MSRRNHSEAQSGAPVRCGYVIVENDFMGMRTVIRDTNAPGKPSVTNDADNLVANLLRDRTIAPGGRLFYYDSEGDLDELVYDETGFKHFSVGPRP